MVDVWSGIERYGINARSPSAPYCSIVFGNNQFDAFVLFSFRAHFFRVLIDLCFGRILACHWLSCCWSFARQSNNAIWKKIPSRRNFNIRCISIIHSRKNCHIICNRSCKPQVARHAKNIKEREEKKRKVFCLIFLKRLSKH